jgi:hypothetical protein
LLTITICGLAGACTVTSRPGELTSTGTSTGTGAPTDSSTDGGDDSGDTEGHDSAGATDDGDATGSSGDHGPTSGTTSMTSTGASESSSGSDSTGVTSGACGWGVDEMGFDAYVCGGSGADPGGVYPMECPPGASAPMPCGDVTYAGCCTPEGSVLRCAAGPDGIPQLYETECE